MSIMTYAKEHPWATGTIVIVGGIIFIMIVRGGSSGSSGGATGPTDAQIQADAVIQAAQINAQAAAQSASIGAGVQLNSDNKAAEVAMTQINAQKELGLGYINAQTDILKTTADAQAQHDAAILGSISGMKSKDKKTIIQTYITGQYAPSKYNTQGGSVWFPQAGNTAGGIISSVGGLFSGLSSIFSDQRLKENITHVGYDAKGRDVYEYNYKGSNKRRRGYIAQSMAAREPQHVFADPGTGFLKITAYG